MSVSPTDTELSSSWKQRPPARDIPPPSVALCLSLSGVVSLQSDPHPPLTSSSPATHVTDNTTGSDTDNPQYLMTGACLSLSLPLPLYKSGSPLPSSLSSRCLVTSGPRLVNKSQIDCTADCSVAVPTCDPSRSEVLAAWRSRSEWTPAGPR